MWWSGNNVMGKIELLPTPSGNILRALIESGITVGVSSRGMGSLKPMGEVQEVQDDFELLCWDFVSTPSNPDSFMHLVKEGLEIYIQHNPYTKVNNIITEILCANGSCPIDINNYSSCEPELALSFRRGAFSFNLWNIYIYV